MKLSELERKLVNENLDILTKLTEAFQASINHVNSLNLDEIYDYDDWEPIDAFFDRFERLVDFLFQRVFRLIFRLENRQDPVSLIELANFIVKRWFAESEDILLEIKDLRNKIAHEYIWIWIYYSEDFIHEVKNYFIKIKPIIDNVKTYLWKFR